MKSAVKKLERDPNCWKDKRVLITGITGFIGSRIAEMLVEKGAKVMGFAQFTCIDDMQNLKSIEDKISIFRGDLYDENIVRKVFRDSRPQVVFHMAAITHVHYSFERPVESVRVNGVGTTNLLEAAREYPVEKFVYAGTSEEYGNLGEEYMPLNEDSPLRPSSPYAVGKTAGDLMCQVYYESYKVPCVRVRNFNTFGRKYDTTYVTEKIIFQALKHGEIKLGTSKSTRDFNHVDNVADAFIFLAEHPDAVGNVTVIASEKERTIKEHAETIVKLIKAETGAEAKIYWDTFPPRPNELWRLCGDATKLKAMGYKNYTSYEDGLRNTVKWWKEKLNKEERKLFKHTNLLKDVKVLADKFAMVTAKINPMSEFKPEESVLPLVDKSWNEYSVNGISLGNSVVSYVTGYKPVNNAVQLSLGKSDFKTLHGYFHNYDQISKIIDEQNIPHGLAVTSSVITLDNKLLIAKRNERVSTYKNCWHVFGGFVDAGALSEDNIINTDEHIRRELREELGISDNNIIFSYPTALVKIQNTNRISLLYITKLNLTSEDILKLCINSEEHEKIDSKSFDEILPILKEQWAPDGLAAIQYTLQNHKIE